MHELSTDDNRRWNEWQRANVQSARRSERLARVFGATMLGATLLAVAIAVWRG